ncbi:MAG: thiamine phosphate synthase [Nitrospirae bacterium]|jgi:thiamine-phosphate pyrophosphorylase|nr:thiamine phosphate synthase [Nitrospirota bacterium]
MIKSLVSPLFPLMYVTPEDIPVKPLVQRALDAVAGGVTSIQVRRKEGSAREIFDIAILLADSLPSGFPLIINSRLDVALEAGAWGLHLPEDHIPLERLRDRAPALRLGVSCHSLKAARKAFSEGADYLIAGPVFDTPSKRPYGVPPGPVLLKEVAGSVPLPVLAIGGIAEGGIPEVWSAGASGFAVMGALAYEEDVRSRAFSLRRCWSRQGDLRS